MTCAYTTPANVVACCDLNVLLGITGHITGHNWA